MLDGVLYVVVNISRLSVAFVLVLGAHKIGMKEETFFMEFKYMRIVIPLREWTFTSIRIRFSIFHTRFSANRPMI